MSSENVATLVGVGRARWKIENEQFNVQTNQGYELEHNYGRGQRGLSLVFYLLNLPAFVAHQVPELGDRLYQVCPARESRRSIREQLRVFSDRLEFASWKALLQFHLNEPMSSA
ncbi:MAG: hypothetical protein JST85_17695 [Acidobacteria bacterium]|nr:hypothetical protein [Acidobacteriota bacterium]